MFPSQSRPFVPFRSFYVDLSQPPWITHHLLTTLPPAEPPGARHQYQQEHQLDMITSLLTIIANGLCIIIANVSLIIIDYNIADQRRHQVLDTNISTNWP